MENKVSKKSNFERIVSAFLILFAVSIIFIGFSIWQGMTRAGNESNAIDFVSSIVKAQHKYASVHQGKFARNFDKLIETTNLDKRLSGDKPIVEEYIFEMKVKELSATRPPFFSIRADPKISDGFFATGTMHFYFDSTLGAIKFIEENQQVKADDPSI